MQAPLLPYAAVQPMIYGLSSIVGICINNRGDAHIPPAGFAFRSGNVALVIKALSPGTNLDITYSAATAIIRGMWDMSASFGYSTFTAGVYMGMPSPRFLRGSVSLMPVFGSENGTDEKTGSNASSVLDIA